MTHTSTDQYREQFNVRGEKLAERVHEVIHEGNVSRIIVKHPDGHTIIEIPVTVGIIGAVLAPVAAALGAIGALVAHCTIEVVRPNPADQSMPPATSIDASSKP
jgi:hypothetical protein